jgi:peptide deformylase
MRRSIASCAAAAAHAGRTAAPLPAASPAAVASRGHARIVAYPHSALRDVCPQVTDFTRPELKLVIAALLERAAAENALGLAAPQLGSAERVFVTLRPAAENEAAARALTRSRRRELAGVPPSWVVCVNPRVTRSSEASSLGVESCLSVPDYTALVRRPRAVEVAYEDSEGATVAASLTGLPAVVFQHELDHLDGLLLIDREERAFARRSREEEMADAQSRYLLALAKYYNASRMEERM